MDLRGVLEDLADLALVVELNREVGVRVELFYHLDQVIHFIFLIARASDHLLGGLVRVDAREGH